jgi:hypothetical protein
MIRIDSPKDFYKLDDVHPLIQKYIINYANSLLSKCGGCNLPEIGTVILLESKNDLSDFHSMGLTQSLEHSLNDFAEIIILQGETGTQRLLHAVFILTNSWGIDLYVPERLCSESLRQHLFEEFMGEKVIEFWEC